MAFIQYLKFDGTALPLPDSYDLDLTDVEADSGGETEAGTVQRDVVRSGVVTIGVSFSVSAAWLKRLTAYSKQPKIAVQYFDTEDLALKETEMYITSYKAKLYKDTSYKGLWTVSFTLMNFRRWCLCIPYHKHLWMQSKATQENITGQAPLSQRIKSMPLTMRISSRAADILQGSAVAVMK